MKKTIGFFGDSFCHHTHKDTWTYIVAKHFDATIINNGLNGSSHWSVILDQYKPCDYAVFCWTHPGRLYNHNVTNINYSTAYEPPTNNKHPKIWKAARSYYDNLIDYRKEEYEYEARIKLFIQQLPKDIPTVHLWSMSKTNWKNYAPSKTAYPFNFGHGVEIRPALMSVMAGDLDGSPGFNNNHLNTAQKTNMVAEWVINGLEQMSPLIVDYSDDVEKNYKFFDKVKPE